ncbi:MAG: glutathione S-transferase family protein [Alphaproteobacteria bacterium]|nr:glutathione S-transferase family protein [Alphaproteobacteria bacterium]
MVNVPYTLYHYPLCPFSRIIRLALSIYKIEVKMVQERTWERRADFLKMNPGGTIPLLIHEKTGLAIPGTNVIIEYLEEIHSSHGKQNSLMFRGIPERVEVRRLVCWFNEKFNDEVTRNLIGEKIYRRFMAKKLGGGPPDGLAVRTGIANARIHVRYIGYLIRRRKWLAGQALSYADLAAAAHLSCIDYLGHVPWNEDEDAKTWYARIKSHPVFRPLLSDRIMGIQPPEAYSDLDF